MKLAFKHVQPLRGGLNGLMAPAAVIREKTRGRKDLGKDVAYLAVVNRTESL